MGFGLLGEHLGHSYSPQIHRALGSYSYDLLEVKEENLGEFLETADFTGLNVTIPYKKAVIPYCKELSDIAKKLGAVNTLVRKANGTLIGHNTDYFGFSILLRHSGLQVAGKKALVLGSGGASVTVTAVLKSLGAEVRVISRTGTDNYENIHLHSDTSVIVNTTPVGMYPNTGISPVNLDLFPQLEGVLDLIYNPARTQLLLDAEKRGLVAENGLLMLVAQAKESAEWFTGKKIADTVIEDIYKNLKSQTENIILVGMPGCGKSTIGKLLAEKLQKTFIDADAEIEKLTGKSIPKIFAESGEAGFRAIETQVLQEFGKKSNCVIATGGGCVTKEENYPLLHQNGTIVWLQRSIDALPTGGRPLSQKGDLAQMYAIRKPFYRAFSDMIAENSVAPEETVKILIARLKQEA